MDASVKETAGGESTMMCANFSPSEVNSRRICSEPSNSAGFGGIGPEGSSFKLGCLSKGCITSSSGNSPERWLVKPRTFEILKFEWSRGRRKSQSMISTSAPVWANMKAVLIAVVVLPSDGWLEVTRMVLGAWPAEESSNDVRKWRYDSAT